jgi:hypothetical protein
MGRIAPILGPPSDQRKLRDVLFGCQESSPAAGAGEPSPGTPWTSGRMVMDPDTWSWRSPACRPRRVPCSMMAAPDTTGLTNRLPNSRPGRGHAHGRFSALPDGGTCDTAGVSQERREQGLTRLQTARLSDRVTAPLRSPRPEPGDRLRAVVPSFTRAVHDISSGEQDCCQPISRKGEETSKDRSIGVR